MSNSANFVPIFTASERVRILRKHIAKMTREEFAQHTGISYHQLENIERGKQKINEDIYFKVGLKWPQYLTWLVIEDTGETDADLVADLREAARRWSAESADVKED